MSEHRTERVIEAELRPGWGRLPVAAVVILGFMLAAIVGMTSADSPWVAGDGGDSSPPAVVGEVLAVALASGLCILLGVLWVGTPRRTQARKKAGAIATDEVRSGLRGGSLVLIGGILVVAALLLAFWFLLGQVDQLLGAAADRDDGPRRRPAAPAAAGSARTARLRLVPLRLGGLDRGHLAPRSDCPAQASGARRRGA